MMRWWGLLLWCCASVARADSFDDYTNRHLADLLKTKQVEKVDGLGLEDFVQSTDVLPGIRSTFLVVRTNDGNLCKLLADPARQKVNKDASVPILQVVRFVTFLSGEDRTVLASAKNQRIFGDFRLNLDWGQIVPASLPSDLKFVVDGEKIRLEPVGKAELYVVNKHLAAAAPPKGGRLAVGEKIEAKHFAGVYKLFDDGRRSGDLHLQVGPKGDVSGHFYSDKDGAKYPVEGTVDATPGNRVQFRISFPRTTQFFTGWLFTADAAALAGLSRLEEREAGFYAVRRPD